MNILLTGSTGFIGRNLADVLAASGHKVTGVSRSSGVDFCRMLQPADWLPYLAGVDVVINCVGIIGEAGSQSFTKLHASAPIALFQACVQTGIKKVIQISALGADHTAFSEYHLSKRAADDYLRSLDLDWFVLRPSLIYGRGGKSAELFMWLARLPVIPVIGSGQQVVQPVHIGDVVATVLRCMDVDKAKLTLDIVGSDSIAFAEWLQLMRDAQGFSRAVLLPIPFSLAIPAAHVARFLNPIFQPENLQMLKVGYRADVQPLQEFLGRAPLKLTKELFFMDAMTSLESFV
ncbi:MAG: NAD-dependent epimerase/dehydratase family protein [Spongiibacteraceae bacterium]